MAVFLPEIDPETGQPTGRGTTLDFSSLPKMEPERRNAFMAGLSSGVDNLQGLGGSFAAAIGHATGIDAVKDWGNRYAAQQAAEAQANGRPDLATAPWREGGSSWLPWLAYNIGQQVPTFAAALGTGNLAGAAVGATTLGARAIGAGATALESVPWWLGGATGKAAQELSKTLVGGAAVPWMGAGSMYQEANEREQAGGEAPTRGEAFKALALGPAYQALETLGPGAIAQSIKASGKGLGKGAALGALKGAVTEMPTEAAQEAMELTFRPDLSAAQKSERIIDAALTGGFVGGFFGGSAGAIGGRRSPRIPTETSTDAVQQVVDQQLGIAPPPTLDEQGITQGALGGGTFTGRQTVDRTNVPMTDAQITQAALGGVSNYGETNAPQPPAPPAPPQQEVAPEPPPAPVEPATPAFRDTLDKRIARRLPDWVQNEEDAGVFVQEQRETRGPKTPGYVDQLAEQLGLSKGPDEAYRDLQSGVAAYRAAQAANDSQAEAVARAQVAEATKILETYERIDTRRKGPGTQSVSDESGQAEAAPEGALADQLRWAQAEQDRAAQEGARLDQQELELDRSLREQIADGPNITTASVREPGRGVGPARLKDLVREELRATRIDPQQFMQDVNQILDPIAEQEDIKRSGWVNPTSALLDPEFERNPGRNNQRLQLVAEINALPPEAQQALAEGIQKTLTKTGKIKRRDGQELQTEGFADIPTTRQEFAEMIQATKNVGALRRDILDTLAERKMNISDAKFALGGQKWLEQNRLAAPARPDLPRTTYVVEGENAATPPGAPVKGTERIYSEEIKKLPTKQRRAATRAMKAGDMKRVDEILNPKPQAKVGETQVMGRGFTAEAAERIIRPLLGPRAPEVYFIDTRDPNTPMPGSARDYVHDVLVNTDWWGVKGTFNGRPVVGIAADRHLTIEQLKATVFHEVLGHVGMDRAFRERRIKLLEDLYKRNPEIRALADAKKTDPTYADRTDAFRTEEVLADLSEYGPQSKLPFWQQFKALVKQFARRAGLSRLMGAYTDNEIKAILQKAHKAGMEGRDRPARVRAETNWTFGNSPRTPGEMNAGVRKLVQRIKSPSVKEALRDKILYVAHFNDILQLAKNHFKGGGVQAVGRAHQLRQAAEAGLYGVVDKAYRSYEQLIASRPDAAERLDKLMIWTKLGIDPRKTPEEHDHFKGDPNEAFLRKTAAEAHKMWNDLARTPGKAGQKVFEDFVRINEMEAYSTQASALYHRAKESGGIPQEFKDKLQDPDELFFSNDRLRSSVETAHKFWKDQADTLAKQLYDIISKERNDSDMASIRTSAIAATIQQKYTQDTQMERAPYFHMGRFGGHFVSFNIRAGEDGKADPKAVAAVAKRLRDDGWGDIELANDEQKRNVYIRVETPNQRANLRALADQLAEEKLVEKVAADVRDEGHLDSGVRARLDKLIERIQASHLNEDELKEIEADDPARAKQVRDSQAKQVDDLRRAWLEMLPDTASAKILAERQNVPGHSREMTRAWVHRAGIWARTLGGSYGNRKVAEAMTSLSKERREARLDPKRDIGAMAQIYTELQIRESERIANSKPTWIDKVRAINHAYFLALSPAYVMLNLVQVPNFVLPEFMKNHSFMNSSRAIASGTTDAYRVMKEVFKESKKVGWKHIADAVITREAIENAIGKGAKADFLVNLVNTGAINLGASARELGRVAEGREDTALDTTLRMSSMAGHWSETYTRVLTALAAYDLQKTDAKNKMAPEDYARHVIDQALFNYSNWATGRAFGKTGFAGKVTPGLVAFQSYQFQALGKLFREMYNAFAGDTREEKVAAAKFLGSHLAAMGVFAGTLGLPFVTVIARVIDGLRDLLDDDNEPYDFKAAYRNFLADVFGRDVGEMLARGVTRGIGADISSRVGEQDLIPGSKILADRRKWSDSSKDWALDLLGSPIGMGMNVLKGVEKVYEGDVIGGMTEMAPTAIKNLGKGFKMTQDGYVDGKGNKLPMSPGALSIFYQLAGFTPDEKAEYDEAKRVAATRKGEITREAQNIRKQLASALENRDMDTARSWMQQARDFDKANPGYAVLPGLAGTLQRRAQERTRAGAMGTPLGVNMKDIRGIALTDFANF